VGRILRTADDIRIKYLESYAWFICPCGMEHELRPIDAMEKRCKCGRRYYLEPAVVMVGERLHSRAWIFGQAGKETP
jgi:hypothetical protein